MIFCFRGFRNGRCTITVVVLHLLFYSAHRTNYIFHLDIVCLYTSYSTIFIWLHPKISSSLAYHSNWLICFYCVFGVFMVLLLESEPFISSTLFELDAIWVNSPIDLIWLWQYSFVCPFYRWMSYSRFRYVHQFYSQFLFFHAISFFGACYFHKLWTERTDQIKQGKAELSLVRSAPEKYLWPLASPSYGIWHKHSQNMIHVNNIYPYRHIPMSICSFITPFHHYY